jgi:hypothetical protein
MKLNWLMILMLGCLSLNTCAGRAMQNTSQTENGKSSNAKVEGNINAAAVSSAENTAEMFESNKSEAVESQTGQPRTVRDFFNLLPQKYFPLIACESQKDKNCDKARKEYVKQYLRVEDTANGYWESGCDGGQSCLQMALFKRPNAAYIVAVHTSDEMGETNYFLEYKNGKWFDISAQVIPEFSDKNIYELPRKGTTIEVFKKDFPEPSFSERGAKIYNLEWKNGKFTRQK